MQVLEHIAWTQDALLRPWSTCVADASGQYGRKKERDVQWGLFFLAPTLLVFQTPSTQANGQTSIFTWNELNANEQISCSRSLTLGSFEVRRLTWP